MGDKVKIYTLSFSISVPFTFLIIGLCFYIPEAEIRRKYKPTECLVLSVDVITDSCCKESFFGDDCNVRLDNCNCKYPKDGSPCYNCEIHVMYKDKNGQWQVGEQREPQDTAKVKGTTEGRAHDVCDPVISKVGNITSCFVNPNAEILTTNTQVSFNTEISTVANALWITMWVLIAVGWGCPLCLYARYVFVLNYERRMARKAEALSGPKPAPAAPVNVTTVDLSSQTTVAQEVADTGRARSNSDPLRGAGLTTDSEPATPSTIHPILLNYDGPNRNPYMKAGGGGSSAMGGSGAPSGLASAVGPSTPFDAHASSSTDDAHHAASSTVTVVPSAEPTPYRLRVAARAVMATRPMKMVAVGPYQVFVPAEEGTDPSKNQLDRGAPLPPITQPAFKADGSMAVIGQLNTTTMVNPYLPRASATAPSTAPSTAATSSGASAAAVAVFSASSPYGSGNRASTEVRSSTTAEVNGAGVGGSLSAEPVRSGPRGVPVELGGKGKGREDSGSESD